MVKLPYRNNMNFVRNDEINNIIYGNTIGWKPHGLWYSIRDSLFKWGELTFGDYLYEIKLKPNSLSNIDNENNNKILSIKNIEDIDKFQKKYGKTFNRKYKLINWKLVSLNNAGIEIKNYDKIMKKLREDRKNFDKYSWLYTFDFK